MTRASIVIPVFNRAHLVHRAIDSALAQTIPCEVILVDHGSTDDIGTVVAKYGDRIRYIRRDEDHGPVASWIDGVENTTSEFVHLTYDDDWLQPTFIERCLERFDDDVAFVYTRATIHYDTGLSEQMSLAHPTGRRSVRGIVRYLLRTPLTISPGCALFRRSDLLRNLLPEVPGASGRYGKNAGVGEDVLVFLLTSLHYPYYVHIREPLADFLAHPGSITIDAQQSGKSRMLADAYRLAKAHYLSCEGAIIAPKGVASFAARIAWRLQAIVADSLASCSRRES